MKLYRILFDENYKFLTVKSDADMRFLRKKLATAIDVSSDNKTIELVEVEDRNSNTDTLADFPGFFSGGILAREVAKNSIEPILSCGQWVSMFFQGEKLYYFNTISTEDVLDLEKSEVSMFDGYITDIRSFVFKNIERPLPLLFKLENHITYPPVATQEFVTRILKSGLTGLIFEEI